MYSISPAIYKVFLSFGCLLAFPARMSANIGTTRRHFLFFLVGRPVRRSAGRWVGQAY